MIPRFHPFLQVVRQADCYDSGALHSVVPDGNTRTRLDSMTTRLEWRQLSSVD
jgi:hypothetical protein